MKYTYHDILNSIPVPYEHRTTAQTIMIYKLGVLAGWMARLANQDMTIRQELEARLARSQPGVSVRTVRRDV